MSLQDTLKIDRMTGADVAEAAAIEARSIPRPWPIEALRRDVEQNRQAVYYIARLDWDGTGLAGTTGRAVGFVGAWVQADEMHITTVAVHPSWRRRGIGRRLMVRAIEHARATGVSIVTLEVRTSNTAAQQLYADLGFAEVGRRRGYYADNGEDALILSTPPLDDPLWIRVFARARERG